MLVLDKARVRILKTHEEIFREYSSYAAGINQHCHKGDLVMKKDTLIWKKCQKCGNERQVQYQSYLSRPDGVCLSCAALERSKDKDYLKKISRIGEDHWAYGLRGKDSPNFGIHFSQERRDNISKSKSRILPNGLTVAESAARKSVITKRLSGAYEKSVAKTAMTKDKNNTWVTYKTDHYKGFYYRSSLEKRFLEEQDECGRLHNFSNCNFSILYCLEGKEHRYIPDFLEKNSNTIIEIKCGWTWDNNGENCALLATNKAKLLAAHNAGYNVKLVIYNEQPNGKYIGPEVYEWIDIKEMV